MNKIYLIFLNVFGFILGVCGQNPGLVISEFYQNPGGIDSPFEYVELLATDDIDFTTTPYTIIVSNNGTATVDGWIAGGSLTYAFEITTGTVSIGDVVYVGGNSMTPTGLKLREINTGTTDGDGGIGNSNPGGVFGNGGGNGDGIAVFNLPVASITSSTVPTDAIIYGSGVGGAEVGPTDGYEMPINEFYDGGKLNAADFVALDADLTVATGGVFDLVLEEFVEARTFGSGAATDGISEIIFAEIVMPKLSFILEDATVLEEDGIVAVEVELTDPNGIPSLAELVVKMSSTATAGDDFILLDTTISFAGDIADTLSLEFELLDDILAEQSEYIIITMDAFDNAEFGENEATFLYVSDNDRVLPTATNELKLELLTSFSTGIEEESSAEIVVYDTVTNNLFVVNSIANQIDIIDFSEPELPLLLDSIEFDSVGFINSVAVFEGVLAVAVAAPIAQDSGFVSFWNTDGTFLNRLIVGALPDMVTFNHSGSQLIAACEGEPDDDYLVDPNGGVSIIEISGDIADLTSADVTNLDFTGFDADEDALKAAGVRVFGLGASVAQDMEPEFVTVLEGDLIAHVVLQENNSIAVVDLLTKEIIEIRPLGTIDHSLYGYGLDASNRTEGINIANFPIKGMFMPDAIDNISILGTTYLVTANEGDSRDYDGYSEEERVGDLNLDSLTFLDRDYLQNSHLLGRLKTTTAGDDIDGDGDFDEIYSYGTRSFSIWNETSGELVFDSGDLIEQIIAAHPDYAELFNAHNEGGELELKNRSDDKGPEPEGIATAIIDGNAYLFVSLERVGGAMVFNINDVENPSYIGYQNNRDAETNGPDRGAEGMIFIDAEISPNGHGLLVLANEVSSTITVYEVNSCLSIAELELTTADDLTAFCVGDSLEINVESTYDLAITWDLEGELIEGEMEEAIFATVAGNYQANFVNAEEACSGTTDTLHITVNELPLVEASVSADSICFGDEVVFSSTGAETLNWQTEDLENDVPYIPETAGDITYFVIGEDENGCKNMDSIHVIMAEEIVIDYVTTDEVFGDDGEIDITVNGGFGGYVYDWDIDGAGDFDDTEDLSELIAGTYVVLVEDEFGCSETVTITIDSQVGFIEQPRLLTRVYPNPTSANLSIEMSGSFNFQLLDINSKIITVGNGMDKAILSMADLAQGVYFVQVTNGDQFTNTIKVIKQ
jgi:hypothetical protein